MKSNSLARFRRKRRIKTLLIILLAVFIGFLLAAEGRYAFFRINEIKTDNDMLSNSAVWGIVDSKYERFWPAFWIHSAEYESLIEKYYPVKATLALCGFGKFRLDISPLIPLCRMYWGDKYWFISEEEKLWLTTLPENALLAQHKAFDQPVLLWSSDRITPVDLSKSEGNIFTLLLPLKEIMSWYRMLDKLGWTKNVKYVHAEMNEGMSAVEIIFYAKDGGDGAVVLLPDDVKKWSVPASALNKLYGGNVANIPQDLYVDCIFSNKILLRNRAVSADDVVHSGDITNKK